MLSHGCISSIVAGNFVNGANILGMANGTTSGMAPLADIAMYKVCSSIGYPETVILAVIDTAIEDGVDVLYISFGTKSNQFWTAEALENMNVKGKFVLCIFDGNVTRIDKGHHVKDASGAGMILMNDELQGFNISA
uniref:Xylem serine proteinase 1 n=1 Tax=Solanum tuberosum TaxID=4113 RepID=M1DZV8_SOLTU